LEETFRTVLAEKGPVLCVVRTRNAPGEVAPRATASGTPISFADRFAREIRSR
jgi:hypothetical protein